MTTPYKTGLQTWQIWHLTQDSRPSRISGAEHSSVLPRVPSLGLSSPDILWQSQVVSLPEQKTGSKPIHGSQGEDSNSIWKPHTAEFEHFCTQCELQFFSPLHLLQNSHFTGFTGIWSVTLSTCIQFEKNFLEFCGFRLSSESQADSMMLRSGLCRAHTICYATSVANSVSAFCQVWRHLDAWQHWIVLTS